MGHQAIVIECWEGDQELGSRRTYEVEQIMGATEGRTQVEELVARIYPDAVALSYADEAATFKDGARVIVARCVRPADTSAASVARGQEALFAA